MRSTQKDIHRMTSLTALNPIPNAASGNGIFSDGTPWHMVRTATGEYTLYFDARLIPISGSVGGISPAKTFYIFEVIAAGSIRVQCSSATAAVNASFDLTMTCLDTRT